MSAAGEALQMLPASVARFRIWTAPDDRRRLGQGLEFAPDPLVGGDVGHHRPRPDRQPAVVLADLAVQLGDPLEIDHDPRLDRPVAQPDDQVGPARQWPRLGASLAEQGDGLARAWSVARTRRLASPGLEHPIDFVEQHLRRRRPDEDVRPLGEPPDEIDPRRAERIGIDHRHREAGASSSLRRK